ncbi:hypothetical protein [Halococcus agarilyticus]|uniref:hypothetical protein n=1 Tax=Halococcus agarilyticus TaxID=1232219 RepID=UPI000677945B|nr:hypothetical protein [Halococcus agarilyticus]
MPTAVTGSENVDHSQSIAHNGEFKTDIDPFKAEIVSSSVYFSGLFDEEEISELVTEETISDEVLDSYTDLCTKEFEEALNMQGVEDIDSVSIEELAEEANEYTLSKDDVEALIEIDSQIDSMAEASNAETPVVDGHIACSAVAACVAAVVVVVAAAAAGVAATVGAAVNTTVTTGHY